MSRFIEIRPTIVIMDGEQLSENMKDIPKRMLINTDMVMSIEMYEKSFVSDKHMVCFVTEEFNRDPIERLKYIYEGEFDKIAYTTNVPTKVEFIYVEEYETPDAARSRLLDLKGLLK